MSELDESGVGEEEAGEASMVGRRKPKMLLRYNSPQTWEAANVSEILLRTKPNEPRLFPCSNPDDPASEARALVAYADRIDKNIKQHIEKQRKAQKAQRALAGEIIEADETGETGEKTERFFTIQTAQCLLIYSDKRTQRDVLEHCIRCVVTRNWLYEASLDYERQLAEIAANTAAEEVSSPGEPVVKRGRGRPRKSPPLQPVPVGPAVVKRGRGRPKKNPEQGTLV